MYTVCTVSAPIKPRHFTILTLHSTQGSGEQLHTIPLGGFHGNTMKENKACARWTQTGGGFKRRQMVLVLQALMVSGLGWSLSATPTGTEVVNRGSTHTTPARRERTMYKLSRMTFDQPEYTPARRERTMYKLSRMTFDQPEYTPGFPMPLSGCSHPSASTVEHTEDSNTNTLRLRGPRPHAG
jgi:hypothetical protein